MFNDNPNKRYFFTNKPGHPDSYSDILYNWLILPFAAIGAVIATGHLTTMSPQTSIVLLYAIAGIVLGTLIGMIVAGIVSVAITGFAATVYLITLPLTESLSNWTSHL